MASEPQPYVGPRPFEREDQPLFFGRDREARELKARVVAHPLTLLYAQSGAGKSSLVNARLLPDLEAEGFETLPVARVMLPAGEAQPLGEQAANVYAYAVIRSIRASASADLTLSRFLAERPRQRDELGDIKPLALILDQFEELFTAYPDQWQARRAFLEQLRDALATVPALRILLAMREDFVAHLDPYLDVFPDRLRVRMRLELLREEAAIRAIEGPVEGTVRNYGKGVAAKIAADLLQVRVRNERSETVLARGEFVEPVQLQVVCRTLWESLPAELETIDEDRLRSFGDVDQALRVFYESVLQEAVQTGGGERQLRRWFSEALITPANTRGMVHEDDPRTAALPKTALDLLVSRHLVRAERRHGSRWFELAHDRFVKPVQDSNLLAAKAEEDKQYWMQRSMSFGALFATALAAYFVRSESSDWVVYGSLLFSCMYAGMALGMTVLRLRQGETPFVDRWTTLALVGYLAAAAGVGYCLVEHGRWWTLAGWLGVTGGYTAMAGTGIMDKANAKVEKATAKT